MKRPTHITLADAAAHRRGDVIVVNEAWLRVIGSDRRGVWVVPATLLDRAAGWLRALWRTTVEWWRP